jgi:ABC-type branched-subunit amino acid transport system substrate-binding protein
MKSLRFGVCIMLLISFTIFPVTSWAEKDKIVVGMARPLSGPLAVIGDSAFRPVYETWVDEVNNEGGIYV